MKNVFAAVGIVVVVKKAWELYCEYSAMKQALNQQKAGVSPGA